MPVKNTIGSQEKLKEPVLGTSNKAVKQVEKEIDWRQKHVDAMEASGTSSKQDINSQKQQIDNLQKAVDSTE